MRNKSLIHTLNFQFAPNMRTSTHYDETTSQTKERTNSKTASTQHKKGCENNNTYGTQLGLIDRRTITLDNVSERIMNRSKYQTPAYSIATNACFEVRRLQQGVFAPGSTARLAKQKSDLHHTHPGQHPLKTLTPEKSHSSLPANLRE